MNTESPNPVDKSEPPAPAGTEAPLPRSGPRGQQLRRFVYGLKRRLDWRIVTALLIGLLAVLVWRGISGHAKETAPSTAAALVPPKVPVGRVTREDLYNEVPMAAEFRPYEEVELHAKVSGYVSQMNVDFGDRVKAGQLLATLEVPELLDQLHNALAVEQRAQADYRGAHLDYTRLLAVVKDHPNLVAQQELDTAQAKDGTAEAAIAAAKADVERYQTLVAYTKITAPFDGVVTRRYADPGALIQAGTASETQSMPLVRVSDNYLLRLDFPVSALWVKDIRVGDAVEVRVESLGGKSFTGAITRSTLRVNSDTRTMMTEIEVPNPNLELVPGMYAEVVLKVQRRPQALVIPIEAVPAGQTSSVYVVTEPGQIQERQVSFGINTPTKFEVTAGLKEGELVFVGRRSQVHPGEKVQPTLIDPLAQR
ncbi:Efflux transporter, RND family, MFP subunit [Verrucomicrobia bacterium]|nr:Efflux transporter, RND family, MFP subunit [Verrucomicrobiota bacterium]